MNKRLQGDAGVSAAIYYYTTHGYNVSVPLTEATRYDLIVENGSLKRVQCKTGASKAPSGNYIITLKTSGGNKSGTGKVKTISQDECDELFVLDGGGTMYVIPVAKICGMHQMVLGGKWTDYRVAPAGI